MEGLLLSLAHPQYCNSVPVCTIVLRLQECDEAMIFQLSRSAFVASVSEEKDLLQLIEHSKDKFPWHDCLSTDMKSSGVKTKLWEVPLISYHHRQPWLARCFRIAVIQRDATRYFQQIPVWLKKRTPLLPFLWKPILWEKSSASFHGNNSDSDSLSDRIQAVGWSDVSEVNLICVLFEVPRDSRSEKNMWSKSAIYMK